MKGLGNGVCVVGTLLCLLSCWYACSYEINGGKPFVFQTHLFCNCSADGVWKSIILFQSLVKRDQVTYSSLIVKSYQIQFLKPGAACVKKE